MLISVGSHEHTVNQITEMKGIPKPNSNPRSSEGEIGTCEECWWIEDQYHLASA